MSVKELKLSENGGYGRELIFEDVAGKIDVAAHGHDGSVFIELDRNQAYLLKLWLEEHLK